MFPTEFGPVQCATVSDQTVHRIGYKPQPWQWAAWEYAQGGSFMGRWDDPAGNWRAIYVGANPLACYLEVLASFRPDPDLAADMDAIETDDDDAEHTTVPPGKLPRDWCEPRLLCTGQLAGRYALPSHHETLPTLREQFLSLARNIGLHDVDAAAVRDGDPRELTQSISAWIYELVGHDGDRISGIQYQSRHGDDFALWAIYERGTADSPPEVSARAEPKAITDDDDALSEAMRIHRIDWHS